MVEYVADAFDVETDRLGSPFDVANYVVIERLRDFGLKQDLYFSLSLGADYTIYGLYLQGVSPIHLALNGLSLETEGKRYIFQILETYDLFVLATD